MKCMTDIGGNKEKRVNIVGAGLAGLSAAISLAENGIKTNLISVQPSERAQSIMAEGGINAVLDTMNEDDTVVEHFDDTMKGGCNLADPNAVRGLTEGAPKIVRWLYHLGVPFNMEGTKIIQRNFGGQKKKRTAFSKSSTGKVVMTALIDEARKYEVADLIKRFPHHEFVEADIVEADIANKEDSEAETNTNTNTNKAKKVLKGIWVRDTYSDETIYLPGNTIFASGGLNGIFPGMTTGTTANTGDVTAKLFSQGVSLANLEFIQYHPTTLQISGKRMLVSEAARSEGGRLFVYRDDDPWYFMEEKYPELGNLMPRDVVSREMYKVSNEMALDGKPLQVYLDMRGISQETWDNKLSDLREEIIHYTGNDPKDNPVPVSPGIHFFMGGINVDEEHRTNIEGLYAAGECACQYHGANRLGANSMLGAIYGGKIAAKSVVKHLENEGEPKVLEDAMNHTEDGLSRVDSVRPSRLEEFTEDLKSSMGIIRKADDLMAAIDKVDSILKTGGLNEIETRRVLLGKAMVESALARRESRGAHTRSDFELTDDEKYRKITIADFKDGAIEISFVDIPELREGAWV